MDKLKRDMKTLHARGAKKKKGKDLGEADNLVEKKLGLLSEPATDLAADMDVKIKKQRKTNMDEADRQLGNLLSETHEAGLVPESKKTKELKEADKALGEAAGPRLGEDAKVHGKKRSAKQQAKAYAKRVNKGHGRHHAKNGDKGHHGHHDEKRHRRHGKKEHKDHHRDEMVEMIQESTGKDLPTPGPDLGEAMGDAAGDAAMMEDGATTKAQEAALDKSTSGMYDADVRAAKAFAAFDDDLDSLKNALTSKAIEKKSAVEEKLDEKMHPLPAANLGEDDSMSSKTSKKMTAAEKAAGDQAGDAAMQSLMGADSASSESSSESSSKKDMGESQDSDDDDEDSNGDDDDDDDSKGDDDDDGGDDDDSSEMLYSKEMLKHLNAFIQIGNSNVHNLGESLGDASLVTQDLDSMDSSLVQRASVEAAQYNNMNSVAQTAASDVNSVADASAQEAKMAGVADVIETTLLDQKAEHQKQFKDPTASKGEKKALQVVGVEEAPKNVASKDVKEADDDVSKAGNLATQLQSAEAAEAKKMVDEAKVQESNMIKHAQEEDHKMESQAKTVILDDIKKIKDDEDKVKWHMKKGKHAGKHEKLNRLSKYAYIN